MKEISIEEKAKRYDEAIEKFDVILNLNIVKESGTIFADDVRKILPELAESDDERIRKALIDFFSEPGRKEYILNGFTVDDILAWLEKQGSITKLSDEEQNKFAKDVLTSCALSFIDYLDAHKYEDKMCVSNGECEDIENAFHNAMWDRLYRYYCKYIEKQGEQKPADKIEQKPQRMVSAEAKEAMYDKPAWSEEDEKILDRVITNYESGYLPSVEKRDEIIEKLESLKGRVQPQNTWKPSDEQIMVLAKASEIYCGKDKSVLYSLYNDLKKLREE